MYSKVKLTYWIDVFNSEIGDFDTISIEKEHDLVFLIKSSKNTQELLLESGFEDLNIPKHCTEIGRDINIDGFTIDKTYDDYEFIEELVINPTAFEEYYAPRMVPIMKGLFSHIKHMEYDGTDEDEDLNDD